LDHVDLVPPSANEIDLAALPRAVVGGIKRDAVEDVLRRLQWNNARLAAEQRALQARVDELLRERTEQPAAQMSHREVDEVARLALASVQRTARELRESTRLECELMLKKARERVAEYDREHERSEHASRSEVERLDRTVQDLRRDLRSVLDTISAPGPVEARRNGSA